MEFSHKWANQVLKGRGMPSPGLDCLETLIQKAGPDELSRLYGVFQRLERGTEATGEADWLIGTLRVSKVLPELVEGAMDGTVPDDVESSTHVAPLIAEVPKPQRKASYIEAKSNRPKHHIYGLKGALTLEMDLLRGKSDEGSVLQTVILEAAVSTAPRSYDWAHKIAFQFMRRELPLLACALLGLLERPLELGNHGQSADKFVVITDQGDKVFVQVKQGARTIAVPVGPADVHAWTELVMRALASNTPAMGDAIQYASLNRIAAMENKRVAKAKGK